MTTTPTIDSPPKPQAEKPTKKERAKLWSYDLETTDWDKVNCAVFVSSDGDVERFQGPGTIERAARFQEEVGGTHVAHAGGIFDTLLISQARTEPWEEVVMSGSAVLLAKAGRLKVRDTFRWWLSGLKKVGQYLDKQDRDAVAAGRQPMGSPGRWLKKDVDRSRIGDLTEAETLDYCESDARILLQGVLESLRYLEFAGARRAWTAGASALQLLQAREPGTWGMLGQYTLPLDDALRASEAIRGARVETWALGKVENVYCYDVKSAYPAAYATEDVGIGAVRLAPGERGRDGSVYRCRWFWPWRGPEDGCPPEARVPPVLDDTTGAGAGWCEGWCIEEEIAELERWVVVDRLAGWAPRVMVPVGQTFVRDLYAEKEKGSFFAKVFLNSLHGKASEQPIKESWTSGERPTEFYGPEPVLVDRTYWRWLNVAVDKRGRVARHIQPLMAAHILGRARIRLWKMMSAVLKAGGELYYCDTDSIHCSLPPEKMPFPLGGSLGMLASEGGPFTGLYLGPKAYCLVDPTTGIAAKGACKGVPWGALKDGVREQGTLLSGRYRQARGAEKGTDLRREVFEEALRAQGGALIVKEGIATWAQGLRSSGGWKRAESVRTLHPHERGKAFARGGSPTSWVYRTPAELLIGRGVEMARDPFFTKNAEIAENAVADLWGADY